MLRHLALIVSLVVAQTPPQQEWNAGYQPPAQPQGSINRGADVDGRPPPVQPPIHGGQYQQQAYQPPPPSQQYQQQAYQPPPASQQYQQQAYQPTPPSQQYQPPPASQQYQPPSPSQQYQPTPPSQQYQPPPPSQQYQQQPPPQYNQPPPPAHAPVGTGYGGAPVPPPHVVGQPPVGSSQYASTADSRPTMPTKPPLPTIAGSGEPRIIGNPYANAPPSVAQYAPVDRAVWASEDSFDDYSWDNDFDDELFEEDHLHPHGAHPHQKNDHSKVHHPGHHRNAASTTALDAQTGGSQSTFDPTSTTTQRAKPSRVTGPRLRRFSWVHMMLSYAHAVVCMVQYLALCYKVTKDKAALGISMQTITALLISESSSLMIRTVDFWRARFFDWDIVYIDGFSTFLAAWCLFKVYQRFDHHREDQLDTFGLNIFNAVYVFVAELFGFGKSVSDNGTVVPMVWVRPQDSLASTIDVNFKILRQQNIKFGELRPTGTIGWIASYTYYLVYYVGCVVPLGFVFFFLRRIFIPLQRSSGLNNFIVFADSLRATALLPQFYMYQNKADHRLSEHLLVLVVCETLLKVLSILYWVSYGLFHWTSRQTNMTRAYASCVQLINMLILLKMLSVVLNPSTRKHAIEKSVELQIPIQQSPGGGLYQDNQATTGTRSRVGLAGRQPVQYLG